ncbi:16913_t:CDS:2 [Racocetra persica]|uniref:16913_t:CDS:1 n=1 Tax=Racocetra persica TaxID=160502 RepID=A0ACA9MJ15_9GLOM|nr:16913_t:CDS:2 [Racocetra persica]
MEEFIVHENQSELILETSNISADSNFIRQEPFLYKLHENDRDYKYVSELFLTSWKHLDKLVPTIVSLWKIFCPKDLISRHNLYRKDDGELCFEMSCSLCCILKEGYKLEHAKFGLFGKGIYFSSISSKCDNFSINFLKKCDGINYKMMLLNSVALGRIYKPIKNDFTFTSPPPGYDSVCGDPNTVKNLKDLKFDEIIVYKEEASIPHFLIVYQS